MLSLRAFGYDSCPMEGIDSARIKSYLTLPKSDQICMVISAGKKSIKWSLWEENEINEK